MLNNSITTRVTRTIMVTGTLFILIIYTSLYFINIEKSNNFNKNNLNNIIKIVRPHFNTNTINDLIQNDKYIKEITFDNKTYTGSAKNEKSAFRLNFEIDKKPLSIKYGDSSQDEYVNALKLRMGVVAFGFYILVFLISLRIKKVLSPFEDIVEYFRRANVNNMSRLQYKNKNVAQEFLFVEAEINTMAQKLNSHNEKINFLAFRDELTSLYNRRAYYKDISEFVNSCDTDIYLMFLDLDGFKNINDKYGHKSGDIVLRQIAKRISKFDNVYRVGGDEFVILLKTNNIDKIIEVAKTLISSISEEIYINNEVIKISTSIGISAISPNNSVNSEDLLKEADIAMYEAKNSGKNQFKFITKDILNKIQKRNELLKNLKTATENEEFDFVIQPQVNSLTNEIIGGEALIRWKKDGKLLSPFFFINELEDSVFIIPVSNQIIRSVFLYVKNIVENFNFNGRIAINLAEKHFNDKNFMLYITNALNSTGCNPKHIEFEITERWDNIDSEIVYENLKKLKKIGFYISIDDFGEDNSSFKRTDILPIDKIKLDKNFADRIFEEKSSVNSIISTFNYSKLSNRDFIIEGVETENQVKKLKNIGIYNIQGYVFYKPLSKEEFKFILKK